MKNWAKKNPKKQDSKPIDGGIQSSVAVEQILLNQNLRVFEKMFSVKWGNLEELYLDIIAQNTIINRESLKHTKPCVLFIILRMIIT